MGLTGPSLSPPQKLSQDHDVVGFDCGNPDLNDWIISKAKRNQRNDASRTFVILDSSRVVAFYCLAAGAEARFIAPKPLQRNMPDPLPVIVLGRLAVDVRYAGRGLGRNLVADAMKRVLPLSEEAGIKALAVHAIDSDAAEFYRRLDFIASPYEPLTMFLPIAEIRRALFD